MKNNSKQGQNKKNNKTIKQKKKLQRNKHC